MYLFPSHLSIKEKNIWILEAEMEKKLESKIVVDSEAELILLGSEREATHSHAFPPAVPRELNSSNGC